MHINRNLEAQGTNKKGLGTPGPLALARAYHLFVGPMGSTGAKPGLGSPGKSWRGLRGCNRPHCGDKIDMAKWDHMLQVMAETIF